MILVNSRCLNQPMSGVQRYTAELLRLGAFNSIAPKSKQWGAGIRGHTWEQFVLPLKISSNQLLFSPANTGPLGLTNQVVTIHDVATLDHPEWFSPRFAKWYQLMIPRLISICRCVITVSHYSKDRIIHHCKQARSKIHVVHNGVSDKLVVSSSEALSIVHKKYNLDKPYFLFVGSLEPRKNLDILLQAWKRTSLHEEVDLILAGGTLSRVFSDSGRNDLPRGVRAIGRFSDEDLSGLYTGSLALVYPSFYEGFGLPILEAMKCGTIPIYSNIPSHNEIMAEISLKYRLGFSPNDAESLAARMCETKSFSLHLRNDYISKYLTHAATFSWERCISKTQAILNNLLE